MPENVNEAWAEKRKFLRLNVGCEVSHKALSADSASSDKSQTKNISAGGLCLIVDEKLNPGTILELDFVLPDKKNTIKAKSRVAWIKPFKIGSETEHYDCGVEFTQINPVDRKRIDQYVFSYK